ncbi:CDP-diacylglycerol--glycerol-3-phosphate 3-phosphatidyltransferase [Paenibacillus albiflavus]|uniref:Phosphatidylglycerophosphate synthase n=1 Tax=Paenibacillus albiflavus TaxID=2545760 RepID=A0A4R4EFF2_9BACL|nr:CDP-alcohol phosphatidyltransferase family protein [Paenibacillus albiflavus]TCZ76815.1 CDP-diacylglycerol--glycerol-3-phosphate 3-phosphatidyltransferase [Paenibacillus albiflavus]
MNIPNALTLSRFILIPVFLLCFFGGYVKTSFFILALAGLTDIADGHYARTHKQVTVVGSMLDPLADKLMMIAVIVSLLISGMIPWAAAGAMFIRDVGMIVGSAFFHFRGKKTVPANVLGKLTTVLYYLAILFIIFEVSFAITYLWFIIAFSFITSFVYVFQFNTLNRIKGE